jgi:hypothetical protein
MAQIRTPPGCDEVVSSMHSLKQLTQALGKQ